MSAREPSRRWATAPRRMAWSLPLLLAGCVSQPVDDAQQRHRPAHDTDEAGLWQMLEREEYKLHTSTAVIRDEALQDYLESVLCRVAPAYCGDIRLYVLRSPHFDAAMAPNGMLLVFSGLLVRLENEAQVAAILGHEVGHYAKRHSLEQWRRLRVRLAAMETASTVMSAGADLAIAVGTAARGSATAGRVLRNAARAQMALHYSFVLATFVEQLAYSREQEREADEYGVSQMVAAGYNPGATAAVWDHLVQVEVLTEPRPPRFLRSHPLPEDRKQRALSQAAKNRATVPQTGRDYRDRFLAHMAPFRDSWLRVARQGLDPDLQALLMARQRQIGAPEGLVSFHEASMYRVRNGKGDAARAMEALSRAVRSDGCPAEAFRDYGFALWDDMRTAEARRAFEDYLAAAPGAGDRAMVASYVAELQ